MHKRKYHFNYGRILSDYQIFQQEEHEELIFTFAFIANSNKIITSY